MADARDIDYTGTLDAINVQDALEELASRPTAPDTALIERMVQDAIAAIPLPEDGADADPVLIEQMVQDAVGALPPPKDGEDADPELTAEMIRDAVAAAVAALPPAKPGEPGPPGASVEPAVVARLVGQAVAAIPPAEPGAPGEPGKTGPAGKGVPRGGEVGYILAKRSRKDFDTEWIRVPQSGKASRFAIWNQQGPPGTNGTSATASRYGSGAPSVIAGDVEDRLYFDTSPVSSYNGYVFHNGAWHPFGGGTTPPTATDATNYWFFMLGN